MQTDNAIIYVAGNPDLYPIEYYDVKSETYQGAIPEFLAAFAQEYGYDLRYFQPGSEDRRAELAANQQVDLISGCEAGNQYSHTIGDPLILFECETAGESAAYTLFLMQVSPSQFQTDLRQYASRTSQAEWTGVILQSVNGTPPKQTLPGWLWSAGLAILVLLLAFILTLLRLWKKERKPTPECSEDGLDSLDTLKEAFVNRSGSPIRNNYALICIHLDLDRIGRLWGYERARDLFRHGAQVLRKEADGAILAPCNEDLLILRRTADTQESIRWADLVVQKIRDTFPVELRSQDIAAGIHPLSVASHDFDYTLFHAQQCARTACREGCISRLCQTDQCRLCQERWDLLDDFFKALERNELQLYVQFFVHAGTFRIVGGEALSRWYHPKFGLLSPIRYIPLLEETGQIEKLDIIGMEMACEFLEELGRHQVRDFFLSCNFARKTFCAPGFVRRCLEVVRRHTFPHKLLILEVTESQQMTCAEMEQLRLNIREIREQGLRVIFDDFGVGFSSFRDLQDCPMDGLKLDKELVDNMQTEKGKIILSALVEAGHRMGLTILAEGVEYEEQITILRKLHCDAFQGFHLSVPLPALEAKKRILQGERSLEIRK